MKANREQRRKMKSSAMKRLGKAKSYVVLTFDGISEPIFSYEMTGCDNKSDIRHEIMQKVAEYTEEGCELVHETARNAIGRLKQVEAVQEAKEKRSKELGVLQA